MDAFMGEETKAFSFLINEADATALVAFPNISIAQLRGVFVDFMEFFSGFNRIFLEYSRNRYISITEKITEKLSKDVAECDITTASVLRDRSRRGKSCQSCRAPPYDALHTVASHESSHR